MSVDIEIENFLIGIEAKPKTREAYLIRLNLFFDSIGINAKQLIDENNDDIRNEKLPNERRIFTYLGIYNQTLLTKGYASNTNSNHKATIRSFLNFYDIQIPNSFSKTKRPKTLPENANRFLSRNQIKKILEYTSRTRNKAIIMTMATSGMAANEARNLKIGQISVDENNIGTVRLRREKVEHDYFTFISPEAVETLTEYWNERERNGGILKKSDFVFTKVSEKTQMSERAFLKVFSSIGKRAGYEPGTLQKYCEIRSHALRKFFSSTMQKDGMTKADVDWLLGHIPNNMDTAYFNPEIETLKNNYIRHLPVITFLDEINITTLDVEKFEAQAAELAELKAQINNLDSLINKKVVEILKERFEE